MVSHGPRKKAKIQLVWMCLFVGFETFKGSSYRELIFSCWSRELVRVNNLEMEGSRNWG